MSHPNVLWIITDDQTRDLLSQMQATGSLLVGPGVNFSNGYSAIPWCGPARASMFTGMYAHNHGCLNNKTHLAFTGRGLEQDTVGTRMHAAGYATGFFGKYLNGHYKEPEYVAPGWDRFVALFGAETGTEIMFPGLGSNDVPIAFDGVLEIVEQFWGDGDKVAAKHLGDFIRGHVEGPWFAVFAPTSPHYPYDPSKGHSDDFDGVTWNPISFNEKDRSDKPPWIQALASQDPETMRIEREGKLEELQDVDDQIAGIFAALAETGQAENTVVMLVSDNGYLLGEHRLYGKKEPYEESAGIPFVVKGPGFAPGSCSAFVSQVDLMPTTLELAGLDPDAGRVLDGRSLVGPLTTGDWSGWRKRLLSENPQIGWAMLREGQWSYINHFGRPDGQTAQEIYDLAVDPAQMSNLNGTGTVGAVKDPMRVKVEAMRQASGLALRALET